MRVRLKKYIFTLKRNNNEIITELLLASLLLFTIAPLMPKLYYPLGAVSYLLFIYAFFIKRWSLPFKSNTDIVYIFFLFIILLVILRPVLKFNLSEYRGQLLYPYGFLAHILPFILLLRLHNISFPIVKRYLYIYGTIGIFFFIIDINTIFIDNTNLGFNEYQEYLFTISRSLTFLTAGVIVFFIPHFFSKKVKVLTIICFLLALFIQAFAARRGGILLLLIILCFSLYLVLDKRYGFVTKGIIFVIVIAFISILFYLVADNFALLLERLDKDTRGVVEVYLYRSLDHNYTDWIFGRGLDGTYYFPIGDPESFPDMNRGVIETGYLYYILKGGLLYLFCYIVILLVAFIKGFFFSNNTLCKGMSLYILYNLISLYPFGLPSFSFSTFILWLSVVWCMRSSCLKKTDMEVQTLFNSK